MNNFIVAAKMSDHAFMIGMREHDPDGWSQWGAQVLYRALNITAGEAGRHIVFNGEMLNECFTETTKQVPDYIPGNIQWKVDKKTGFICSSPNTIIENECEPECEYFIPLITANDYNAYADHFLIEPVAGDDFVDHIQRYEIRSYSIAGIEFIHDYLTRKANTIKEHVILTRHDISDSFIEYKAEPKEVNDNFNLQKVSDTCYMEIWNPDWNREVL